MRSFDTQFTEGDDSSVEAAAARWFARSRSGLMTAEETSDLGQWLQSDARHARAYEEVEGAWSLVERVRLDPRILLVREQAVSRGRRARATIVAVRAAALAVFILAGAAVGWGVMRPAPSTTYATKTGETSILTLADGSKVTLDTASAVKVWGRKRGERKLELVSGRAFFEVAKNKSRPFVVHVGRGSVTALGTSFDVRLRPRGMRVVLVEGKVEVRPVAPLPASQPVMMTAGEEVVNEGGSLRVNRANTEQETSWVRGTLVFEERPLRDVVAELNRYSEDKIQIVDPAVGDKPISAVLKTGDATMLLSAIESMKVGRIERRGDRVVIAAPVGK